ncbi:hypothetical protein BU24DRAFT_67808 [Aaosphaeria arxii CBS 175.79]|uniref:Uncharacterized protein n=1 Tax=Aaosphaeria arxii CBS 175.79 TaxID=1450172 RepID=A0A6A5XAJ7_9PLEO|nr:uncharacterized protein BU24DRAFT_67808 [Aaosphaeria arxii CBS 175.79]KAF2009940.1 hypothetical protein BU24DRAFT_67808 [Aaosphaeria arxii CBS 175.79]
MSWSGPSTGVAPYQTHPYAQGQPYQPHSHPHHGQPSNHGQHPMQFQHGPPQYRPSERRPPKKKGNPVITKYPPPPGYRGPNQPQRSYGSRHQNQFQQPQQSYGHINGTPPLPPPPGHPYQGYPPSNHISGPSYHSQSSGPQQNYSQHSAYPQSVAPQVQSHQNSQQGYPTQGYPHGYSYQGSQGYSPSQNGYSGYAHQSGSQPPYGAHQNWNNNNQVSYGQGPHDQFNAYGNQAAPAKRKDSQTATTLVTSQPNTSHSSPVQAQPTSGSNEENEKPQLYLAWDDWDFDFDGAIWPKSNEPVDPSLSLGVIIWRPAKQVTRALPATFEEAEEQALKPPAEKLDNGESVSIYFTIENSHEAFLNIRQTDYWNEIKDDPVFVVFPDSKDMKLITVDACIAQCDRMDEALDEGTSGNDEIMQDSTWNVMDNLEQMLTSRGSQSKPRLAMQSESLRSQKQEDILAMLGVTGSPKPITDEHKAFPFPLVQNSTIVSEETSQISPSQQAVVKTEHTALPAPPSATPSSDQGHPQRLGNSGPGAAESVHEHPNGSARLERSDVTLASSNSSDSPQIEGSKSSAAASQTVRNDTPISRKRSYESDTNDEGIRQQDETFKRKRRSPIDAAYGRR